MNARYYNSNTGRFISQDSYKGSAYAPWTQNLYTYTGNNPVNFVDPTGHYASYTQSALIDGTQYIRPVYNWSQTPEEQFAQGVLDHQDGNAFQSLPRSKTSINEFKKNKK